MNEKKGFTLVELSIVLVIIGLLVGGILVAQSMVSTSQITAQAAQIQQFDAGVENFKTKYNYLPGDAPAFGGDGDKIIDITATSGYDNQINAYMCELVNFWNGISQDNYAYSACGNGSGFTVRAITSGAGKNVPLSKIGAKGAFFIASAMGTGSGFLANTASPSNYYAILNASQIQTATIPAPWYGIAVTTSANSAVKPIDLLALDKKIDDGIANNGAVLSGNIIDGSNGSGGIYTSPLATCSVGAAYKTTDSYECTPLIRIGGSVNDPQ